MRSVELFAGAGGLALGTAGAGSRHKVVIEWDDNACRTLRRNRAAGLELVRDWRIVQGDVRAYDFLPHRGDVSFVSGGPPCQPFSIGGKHRGQDDSRNMFPQAVRAVREIRPAAFLFENVRGLLRESFSKYFGYIVHQLRYPTVAPRGDEEWTDHLARLERLHTAGEETALRYNVVYQIVNAVDFGVPQHRWRVFCRAPTSFSASRVASRVTLINCHPSHEYLPRKTTWLPRSQRFMSGNCIRMTRSANRLGLVTRAVSGRT